MSKQCYWLKLIKVYPLLLQWVGQPFQQIMLLKSEQPRAKNETGLFFHHTLKTNQKWEKCNVKSEAKKDLRKKVDGISVKSFWMMIF